MPKTRGLKPKIHRAAILNFDLRLRGAKKLHKHHKIKEYISQYIEHTSQDHRIYITRYCTYIRGFSDRAAFDINQVICHCDPV